MTVIEHTKKVLKDMKGKPVKEQFMYFLDYYKWYALITVILIAFLIHGVVSCVTSKDTLFSGILINSFPVDDGTSFLQGYYSQAGIDPTKETVAFQTQILLGEEDTTENITALQLIHASVAANETDFVTGQETPFRHCAYSVSQILGDLRNYLPQETLLELSDRLYYIDGAILIQIQNCMDAGEIIYPLPNCPEDMIDPIPVGIDISGCEAFMSSYYPYDTAVYLGITANSDNLKEALRFVDYMICLNN